MYGALCIVKSLNGGCMFLIHYSTSWKRPARKVAMDSGITALIENLQQLQFARVCISNTFLQNKSLTSFAVLRWYFSTWLTSRNRLIHKL